MRIVKLAALDVGCEINQANRGKFESGVFEIAKFLEIVTTCVGDCTCKFSLHEARSFKNVQASKLVLKGCLLLK